MNIAALKDCRRRADDGVFPEAAIFDSLLYGPLWKAHSWPIAFRARCCALRSHFIPKCRVGRGHRAIARNGRVLLASDMSLSDLAGALTCVRLQIWHKAILPGDRPEAYGVVLCVRACPALPGRPVYSACLAVPSDEPFDLALDLGGGRRLEFRRLGG